MDSTDKICDIYLQNKRLFMKSFLLFCLLSFSFTSLGAKSGVSVTVKLSPAGSFQAKTSTIKGSITKSGSSYTAKKLSVKVKDLETGIELRDDHLQKRISGSRITVTDVKASRGNGTGFLEMNKIKKPIRFKFEANSSQLMAVFTIKMSSDYKLKDLKYLGVGAKDVVKIQAIIPIK